MKEIKNYIFLPRKIKLYPYNFDIHFTYVKIFILIQNEHNVNILKYIKIWIIWLLLFIV